MNTTPPEGGTASAPAKTPASKPPVARIVVTCLVVLVTLAAIGIAVPWAYYRFKNVVLREATVRGVITKIGARIDGRIKNVDVEPGQPVTKGQILLRMEDSHLVAALDHARGELRSAEGELESEKLSIEQSRRRLTLEIDRVKGALRKAKGDLEAQQSSLTKLEKQFDRISSLVKTGAAAPAELDKITGDRDKAIGLVSSANGNLEAALSNEQKAANELDGVKVRENHLNVLEAQITIARSVVATAEADLEASVVKAPEDGRVLDRIVNVGGSAKVGEPMISLWIGKAWVEAWIDERDLPKIQVGSVVDISLDARPNQALTGHVEGIGLATDKILDPAVVPATLHSFLRPSAMMPIRIALDDDAPPVQMGLSVLVGIRKGTEKSESVAARPLHGASARLPQNTATTNSATVSKL